MKTVLIAGGAGFLGSHLCEALLKEGNKVICVDNVSTGRRQNITGLENDPNFKFIQHDITKDFPEEIASEKFDIIANLASPASPPKYQELAVETLMVGSLGTKKLLDLALRDKSRYIQASTSEVYGDPDIHPQPESYWGNVNSYGARSMYDESKRFAEALIWVYRHQYNLNTGIVRIFNTYGPNMDPQDGRVVSNFVIQALNNEPITIYGKGDQTRSFCYVSDEIAGIMALINSDFEGPVNIGNPREFTIKELAEKVLAALPESKSKLIYEDLPSDDPKQRRPDITLAKSTLGWEPRITLEEGLLPTIEYFKNTL